ncbi:hypothetical protein L6452_38315 [Arctium lappa]|uniref:Uncharacterized protein n=1 Tax=Arctium lappa TaxID=4217 RepID=A0ACB8Y6J5_ARCLA|nr:hypothetical protein L6452_38315 [Arctium lappa]
MRHPSPTVIKGRDHDAPSPLRKDTPNQAAASALKEATNLKYTADPEKAFSVFTEFKDYISRNPTVNFGIDVTITVLATGLWPR